MLKRFEFVPVLNDFKPFFFRHFNISNQFFAFSSSDPSSRNSPCWKLNNGKGNLLFCKRHSCLRISLSRFLSPFHPMAQINKIALSDIYLHSWTVFLSTSKAQHNTEKGSQDTWNNIYLDTFTQSFFIKLLAIGIRGSCSLLPSAIKGETIFCPSSSCCSFFTVLFRLFSSYPQFIFINKISTKVYATAREKIFENIWRPRECESVNEKWNIFNDSNMP